MDIEKILRSKLNCAILKFFHENPGSIDTGRGIATWINQDVKSVRAALKKLAAMGLLVAHRVSSTTGYSYPSDKKKILKIASFLKKRGCI